MNALQRAGVFLCMMAGVLLITCKPNVSVLEGNSASDEVRATKLRAKAAADSVIEKVKKIVNKPFAGTKNEMRVERVQKDNIGLTHIRMKQYYQGIPVDGTDIIAHVNHEKLLYDIDGSGIMDFNPTLSRTLDSNQAAQIALADAQNSKCLDGQCRQWRAATVSEKQKKKLANLRIWATPRPLIVGNRIVYVVKVAERTTDLANWVYWVDAITGGIFQKIMQSNMPLIRRLIRDMILLSKA